MEVEDILKKFYTDHQDQHVCRTLDINSANPDDSLKETASKLVTKEEADKLLELVTDSIAIITLHRLGEIVSDTQWEELLNRLSEGEEFYTK